MKRVLLAVAPVCHANVEVPDGVAVPYSPEEIAAEVIACARMGVGMVHLHVRDIEGNQTKSANSPSLHLRGFGFQFF